MIERFLPCAVWLRDYNRRALARDLIAALIVTVMLIPQSLAYALLAGLPAEAGLYASLFPLLAYALFGTSRTLSVGPVAVVSLMTAAAVGGVAEQGTTDFATAAVVLAMISGLMLIVLGLLRFGFVTNFLSHPVVSGFITASGVIIAVSQLGYLTGIGSRGETLPQLAGSLLHGLDSLNLYTVAVGAFALVLLVLCRTRLEPFLRHLGLGEYLAQALARGAPVMAILLTTGLAVLWSLEAKGVALVGHVPGGLPAFSAPRLDIGLVQQLALPAMLISLIGFVESVSVGRTLGAKRRQRIDPNQELIGLGAANIASSLSGGFPVTGGFSRSVVNFDAGAETQLASVFTAVGVGVAAFAFTPALYFLPKATLAATIIVAVASLIDLRTIGEAWRYSRADFVAVVITIAITLLLGVELGVLAGVVVSVGMHLHKTTRPHFAVVGMVPGTEHYRNVDRYSVITYPNILSLRIDESLYFANASYLEDTIYEQISLHPTVEHVVLMCPAVNEIDLSALNALEEINRRLLELGVKLHLSEVKGPVMDSLQRSRFLDCLGGNVYMQHHTAIQQLAVDSSQPHKE